MKKLCPERSRRGFTLVELLVVASIMAIVFSLSIVYYNQFNRAQILNQAVLELKNNLRLAQSKALSGEKPAGCGNNTLSGHGLKFTSNKNYKLVALCGGEVDVKTDLSLGQAVVKISGPDLIVFKVLARGVDGAGTISLSAPTFGISKAVIVTSTGEIR